MTAIRELGNIVLAGTRHLFAARKVCCAAAAAICFANLAPAQWSGGPTGPIYYNGGNVGIGTETPAYPLFIRAAGDTGDVWSGIRFAPASTNGTAVTNYHTIMGFRHSGLALAGSTSGSSYARSYLFLNDSGASFGMSDSFTDPLANIRLTILNSGNVGIGTTAPQYKLAVNGTIGTKEVIVTNTGWADYVFKPGYVLAPLRDIEAYIQDNQRLPEMPSEADVRANGVGVGEMQVKLLAKVEELTLHLIRLDKENAELRERLAHVESGLSRP